MPAPGRHAALARSLRGARGGPLDGAAHSGRQPESLPPASGGIAAGQDPADRTLRQSSTKPRATPSSATPASRQQLDEDEWQHEHIRLEPLNPEFEAWDVEPQDFAVVAEWLRVIE